MTSESPFDAGDQGKVSKRKSKAKLTAEREVADISAVLDTYEGRAFVWRLLEHSGMYETSFRGEETHRMAMAEGKRNFGIWLLNELLTIDPNYYIIIRNEAVSRDTREKE